MPIDEIFPDFQRLRTQVEAFASLGARLCAPDDDYDDEVRSALDEVVAAIVLPVPTTGADARAATATHHRSRRPW